MRYSCILSVLILLIAHISAFYEPFEPDSWKTKWIVTSDPKYSGEWDVLEAEDLFKIKNDTGLTLLFEARRHGISTVFPEPIKVTDGSKLVVQYEVKLQRGLFCGGSYLKLMSSDSDFDPSKFNDNSSYVIMFGPDRCGSINVVHLIINSRNPITGKVEEKHLDPRIDINIDDKITHLYRLVIDSKDDTYKIYTDQKLVREGSLLTDFKPSFQPPKEIPDPNEEKPGDWVDEEKIPDPNDVQPDDWVVEETIPDPNAQKPEGWKDEDDGEWEVPRLTNPKYKGKWKPRLIPNPKYKGPWHPKNITNTEYFEAKNPGSLGSLGAVGFELWTMSSHIMFDNIFVGNDEKQADELASLWLSKFQFEKKKLAEYTSKYGIHPYINNLKELIQKNLILAMESPVHAVIIAAIFTISLIVMGFLFVLICRKGSRKENKTIQRKKNDNDDDNDEKSEDEQTKDLSAEEDISSSEPVAQKRKPKKE